MTNEEKILAILEKHGELLTQMQADISGLKSGQAQMQAKQDRMEENLHMVKAYLELDVEKRFDAVNEGIDAILEKLVPEDRVERLEDDVVVLKTAVKALARDVAELKKAQ